MHDVTVRHIGVPKQLNGGHVTVPSQSVPVELFSNVYTVLILFQ